MMRAREVCLGLAVLALLAACAMPTPRETIESEPGNAALADALRDQGLADLDEERTAVRKRGRTMAIRARAEMPDTDWPPPKSEDEMRVHSVPVGAGSCHIIECPGSDSEVMLYDCGSTQPHLEEAFSPSQVRDYVRRILAGRRPKVVISHADKDHYLYVPSILAPAEVESLWLGGRHADYPSSVLTWAHAIRALGSDTQPRVTEEFPVNWHNDGFAVDGLTCGDAPTFVLGVNNGKEKNDHSLMMSVDHGDFRVIFAGDATKASQDAAIDNYPSTLLASVLTASHHGASTDGSNNADWVAATQPLYVIYSAGTSHWHPRCASAEAFRAAETLLPAPSHAFHCGNSSGFAPVIQSRVTEYNTFNSGVVLITSDAAMSDVQVLCNPGPC